MITAKNSRSASTTIQQNFQQIEAYAPIVLAIHGFMILASMDSLFWQWGTVGFVLLLGLFGLKRAGQSARWVQLRAATLFIITWVLLVTTGGVGSYFLIWYFLLITVYPIVLPTSFGVILIAAIPIGYLMLRPFSTASLPLAVLFARTLLVSFLGWLIWSFRHAIEQCYTEQQQSQNQQQQTAAKLKESAQLFQTIQRNFPNGYLTIVNHDLTIDSTGGEGYELYPENPEKYLQLTIEEAFANQSPEDIQYVVNKYQKAFSEGTQTFEITLSGEDLQFTIAPLANGTNQAVQVLTLVNNISERRRAEQRIHEIRKRLTGIIDSAMDAIITIDKNQKIVLFNQSAEKLFGVSAEEAIQQSINQFIPADVVPHHEQYIKEFISSNITSRKMGHLGQLTGIKRNGEEFPIEASISQLKLRDQIFLTVILRDVTERQRIENALRQSEARYRTLFERAKDAILLNTIEDKIVDANPRACDLLGYSKEQLLSMHVDELQAPSVRQKRGSVIINSCYALA